MFGIQALILGAASSSAERTAPVTPRTTAMTNGRTRKPPRSEYIADWKRTGNRSNNCRISKPSLICGREFHRSEYISTEIGAWTRRHRLARNVTISPRGPSTNTLDPAVSNVPIYYLSRRAHLQGLNAIDGHQSFRCEGRVPPIFRSHALPQYSRRALCLSC
jgi:hypothetical protein